MIPPRDKEDFTELFLRNCRSRDTISILLGLKILHRWSDEARAISIWEMCDEDRLGRLNFGRFLIACHVSKNVSGDLMLFFASRSELDVLFSELPPFPLHSTAVSEALELGQDNGSQCDLFVAATSSLTSSNEILFESSIRALMQAAHNAENHDAIRQVCQAEFFFDQLSLWENPRIRYSLCCILFLLSSSRPLWLLNTINRLIDEMEFGELPMDSRKLLMACLANLATEDETASILLRSSGMSQILKMIFGTKYGVPSDLFRLFANFFLVASDVRMTRVKIIFLETVFGNGIQVLLRLDTHGMFYLLEILRRLIGEKRYHHLFAVKLRGVSKLFNYIDQTVLIDINVAPRVAILLSKIAACPGFRNSFLDQEGLEFVHFLYSRRCGDEVVRLSCVETILKIVTHASENQRIPRHLVWKCRTILQDACERGSHVEIISRALDGWRKTIELDPQLESTDSGEIITAASFLLSDSMELRVKGLSVLPGLLQEEENVLAFLGISKTRAHANHKFLLPLMSFLGESSDNQRNAILSIACITKCSHPLAVQLVEENSVHKKLYDLYGAQDEECDRISRKSLSVLFTRNSATKRRLFTEFKSNPNGTCIQLVAKDLETDSECQKTFMLLAADPAFAGYISGFLPLIMTSLDYNLRNLTLFNAPHSKNLSQILLTLVAQSGSNERVKSETSKHDLVSFGFRLMQSNNFDMKESGISIVQCLIKFFPETRLREVSTPSRINAITALLSGEFSSNLTDKATAVLFDLAVSNGERNELFIDLVGLNLAMLIQTLIKRCNLIFLSKIVWSHRVQNILITKSEFIQSLILRFWDERESIQLFMQKRGITAEESQYVRASLDLISALTFALHKNSDHILPGVLSILREGLPSFILRDLCYDEIGRLRPLPSGAMQVPSSMFQNLMKILRETVRSLASTTFTCLGLSLNQLRLILMHLFQTAIESQEAFRPHPSPVTQSILQALTGFDSGIAGCLDRIPLNSVLKSINTSSSKTVLPMLIFCKTLLASRKTVKGTLLSSSWLVKSIISSVKENAIFAEEEILFLEVVGRLIVASERCELITGCGILEVIPALAKLDGEKFRQKKEIFRSAFILFRVVAEKDRSTLSPFARELRYLRELTVVDEEMASYSRCFATEKN